MNTRYILAGIICLIFTGLVGADLIATTISSDGSVMLTTSGDDANGSFSSRAMTLETAQVSRSVTGEEKMDALIAVSGKGPVIFSEYASGISALPDTRPVCTFLDTQPYTKGSDSSMYLSGILSGGEYQVSRTMGTGLEGETGVNGSGLLLFGSASANNRSLRTHGFVTGNMSVRDVARFGVRW